MSAFTVYRLFPLVSFVFFVLLLLVVVLEYEKLSKTESVIFARSGLDL